MSKKHAQDKQTSELSSNLFLETALQLAEQGGGIQKFSLRALGKALNVDPTAVYRYFPSKSAIVTAMGERVIEMLLPDDKQLDGDWRFQLRALAKQAHHVSMMYPALTLHLSSSPYIRTPAGDQLIELGYKALRDAGLSGNYIVLFHEVLYTFTLGIGQIDAQTSDNIEHLRKVTQDHFTTLPIANFPSIHQVAHLMVADGEMVFQLFLEIYLNSIESYASGMPE